MGKGFKQKIEDIKSSLNTDDIIDLVENGLGSDGHKEDSAGNPIFQTVDHNAPGEGSYKLYYYAENRCFISYTGDGDPMDVFELVLKAKKMSGFGEAYRFVCNFFHIDCDSKFQGFNTPEEEIEHERTEDWDILDKMEDYSNTPVLAPYTILNDWLMDKYTKNVYPSYWIDDGISIEAMDKYGIRVDLADQKIIIPHYDRDGKLVGIRGRAYDPWELSIGMKYAPVWSDGECYRHELGRHLYGLDKCKDAIRRLGKVCLVESEKSAMLGYTYYGENNFTVATCGSSGLSNAQIGLLLELGVSEVILAYDRENDLDMHSELTQEYNKKLLRIAQPLTTFFDVYIVRDLEGLIGYKDSPFDRGKEVLEKLMKKKFYVPSLSDRKIQLKGTRNGLYRKI